MLSTPLPSRYRIIEEVGQGGMAVVYRAHDEKLRREVAVKVLHAHLLAEPESRARLEREARAVAKLNHDGILQIFDYSSEEATSSYIVTEFIEGQTLKQFLANRQLPVPELAGLIVIELGEALSHAHSLGILHRDVKPENVMVRKDGVLKLMDFGVAQVVDLERMTVTGQILGSPAYMAPEVLDGRTLDFRSDVFSVGVMLYQMATGVLPFTGKNPHEVLRRVSDGKFADPRTVNRLVSDQLARVIARALAHKPEDRFPTIDAMVDELRRYVADAGLGGPRDELREYLTDTEGYEKALIPRLVSALVASGVREQSSKHRARALELWNRALAFEPHNMAVLNELRRLERGEHLRRWGMGGAALVVLLGMATGALLVARKAISEKKATLATATSQGSLGNPRTAPERKDRPPEPSAHQAAAHPATSSPRGQGVGSAAIRAPRRHESAALEKPAIRGGEGLEDPENEGAAHSDDSAAIPTITLTLGFSPARVEVWMDGKKAFDFGPQQNRIEIPWNKAHRLEFRNDSCCNRKEVTVGPQVYRPPGDHLFVNLDPKPARLVVTLDPPISGATLLIREINDAKARLWRAPAQPGEKIPVPFDAGDEMRKSLEVVIFRGDQTITSQVTVAAGETRPITIHLDK
jgi:tRNA A-37 threonylcarbamoyl transferase component Bud32